MHLQQFTSMIFATGAPRFIRLVAVSALMTMIASTLTAQQSDGVAVTGRVISGSDGLPVVGALIRLSEPGSKGSSAATDESGRYTIRLRTSSATLAFSVHSFGFLDTTIAIPVNGRAKIELSISLTEDGNDYQMPPTVVIGSSTRDHRRLVGTGTQISASMIDLIKPIGTQELLEYVPGINGYADDGMGNSRLNIGMRGLNPRRSARVLVLEDGIPIQPAPYLYPNMYYNPPTERIERVEVLKGSGGIEYGPQTMGGVVNYITSRPRAELGGHLEVSGGLNGLFSLFGEISGIGSERARLESQVIYKRGDGYRDNNGFEQANVTVKTTVTPSPGKVLYIKLNGNHEVTNATYTGLTDYSFRTNPTFNPKEHDLFTINRGALDVIFSSILSEKVVATTKAYANVFDRQWWREDDVFVRAADYEADATNAEPVPWFESGDLVRVGNGRTNYGNLRRFYSAGAEQSYTIDHAIGSGSAGLKVGGRVHWERFLDHVKIGDRPDARDGIYYRENLADSTITILGTNTHYETTALALFARETVRFGRLGVSLGARFEAFEQEQIDRLNGSIYFDKSSMVFLPGLGLNYELGAVNLFGGIHRGYTPPTTGSLLMADAATGKIAGGIDIASEKSWNLELGVRGAVPALSFELAGFAVQVEDLVAASKGTTFKNLGVARSLGVEAGGTLYGSHVSRFLPDLTFSYAFLSTEVIEGRIPSAVLAGDAIVDIAGKELPYAPHHTLSVGLRKGLLRDRLIVHSDLHAVSSAYTDFENIETTSARGDTGPIPGHVTIDAGFSLRLGERWTITAVGKNLTDEITIGSRLHSNPRQPEANISSGILPGPRRHVSIGVGYAFGSLTD